MVGRGYFKKLISLLLIVQAISFLIFRNGEGPSPGANDENKKRTGNRYYNGSGHILQHGSYGFRSVDTARGPLKRLFQNLYKIDKPIKIGLVVFSAHSFYSFAR